MKINGLEANNYLVFNPIRIEVIPDNANAKYLETVYKHNSVQYSHRYYPITNKFIVEIHSWLQLFFTGFECDFDYNNLGGDSTKMVDNKYFKNVDITLNIHYENSTVEHTTKTVTCISGYNQQGDRHNYLNSPLPFNRIYWRGFPFSLLNNTLDKQIVTDGSKLEFNDSISTKVTDLCEGVYVRWLGPDTNYNYWLFPTIEEKETTKEIGVKDRWFLREENQTSNEDSIGLTPNCEFTLSDKVHKDYWPLINTIFRSPEIYFLKKNKAPYSLSNWEKVRIKGQNYTNRSFETAQVYSIDFFYPKQYSQTL